MNKLVDVWLCTMQMNKNHTTLIYSMYSTQMIIGAIFAKEIHFLILVILLC